MQRNGLIIASSKTEVAASRSGPESGEIYAKRHALQRTRGAGGGVRSTTLSKAGRAIISASLILSGTLLTAPAMAEEVIEEQVVTGVRGKPRTVQDSPVPIDVFK